MGGSSSSGRGCMSAKKTMDPAKDAGAGTTGNPELVVAITEIKVMIEQLGQREETVAALVNLLHEKKGEPPTKSELKPRAVPDFAKLSLRHLQDMEGRLEKELLDLKEQESRLHHEIYQQSAYFQKSKSRLPRTLSSNDVCCPMSEEEQEMIRDALFLLNEDGEWGLCWDRRWQGQPMGPSDENLRRTRREGTKKKVAQELGLRYFGEAPHSSRKPQGCHVHIFLDRTPASRLGNAPAGGPYILGRYDVAVTKVCADLDRNWNFIKGAKPDFWVAHAAALNVGESLQAADFPDFIQMDNEAGRSILDEESYFQAMEHILANVAQACTKLHIEHLVFFPFGMGAFLRHLGQLDLRFTSHEELQRLRRRLARSFMKVLAGTTHEKCRIHLCLMFGAWEPQCNSDAFLRALAEPTGDASDAAIAKLRKRLTVYPEGDCLHLAHELAVSSTANRVMLVNGANRVLLGNHWFAGRAKLAIDENLHRRSWRMSAASYLLNYFDGREPEGRRPDELEKNAKYLGGQIHYIDCCKV